MPWTRRRFGFLLFVASLLVTGMVQAAPCDSSTQRWVARAAADTGVSFMAEECWPGGARLRLAPVGAAAFGVELATGEGAAFRRVGSIGLSPLLDVPDFSTIPAPQRDAFEKLADWMGAHEAEVLGRSGGTPGIWWLLLGLATALAAEWTRRRARRREPPIQATGVAWPWELPTVFVVALALRLYCGAWGPHHYNGQGALWLWSAWGRPDDVRSYGPGFPELYGWLGRLAGHLSGHPIDRTVFGFNAALSALSPVLLAVLALRLGLSRRHALLAGLLLAAEPVSVRIAATESYFVPIQCLVLATTVLLVSAVGEVRARRGASSVLAAVAAAACAIEAARIHPAGWLPLALVPLALSGFVDDRLAAWRRLAWCVAGAAWLGGTVLLANHGWLFQVLAVSRAESAVSGSPIGTLALPARQTLAVLAATSLLFVLLRRHPARWLLLPATAQLAALLLTHHIYRQASSLLVEPSYERSFVALPLLAVAALLPLPRLAPRAWLVLATTCALLLPLAAWRLLQAPLYALTVEQREYRWLQAELPALPASCRLLTVERAGPHVLAPPDFLAPGAAPGHPVKRALRSADDAQAAARAAPCAWYYRSSLCAQAEAAPLCQAIEQRLRLEPIAEASLPAASGEVRVRLARVVGVR